MSNSKPFLLGRVCEKSKKKSSKNYKNVELIELAKLLELDFKPRTKNDTMCEAIRQKLLEKNIETKEDLERYLSTSKIIVEKPNLVDELAKYPSFNDFMMFQPGIEAILELLNGITDLSKFSLSVSAIGANSANGFIRKLQYINNGYTLDVVLKSNQTPSSDNLYYEYLAGQCINEFSKYYPFFSRTYGLGNYKTDTDWKIFNKIKETSIFLYSMNEYLNFLNPTQYTKNVETSCIDSKNINIMTQYIPIKRSLWDYIVAFSPSNKFNPVYKMHLTSIISTLYLTYGCLSKLANYFTHYDLHMSNIVLYEIPDRKYIDVVAKTSSGDLQFKTRYLPIIIDYGRSYFNCEALSSGLINSPKFMKSICSLDSNSPFDICPDYCGDEVGYSFMGDINPDGSVSATGIDDYYINRGRRNISHDLRGLSDLSSIINFDNLENVSYIKLWKDLMNGIVYNKYNTFGMPEIMSGSAPGTVNNVHEVYNSLETMIRQSEFINDFENLLKSYNNISYGILTVDFSVDTMNPFEFIKYP